MRHSGINKAFKGFTIIEILIAIIIIGILVAIIVPRLATRADLARRRGAESDIEEIRKAQEHAGIDTGYYYRLYVLDDNPGGDGYGTGNANDINDGLRDEFLNQIASNPIRMFISPTTGQMFNDTSAVRIYAKMVDNETSFGWQGRYLTWHNDYNNNDIPDDPWNRDYLFFTQEGLVLEPDGLIVDSCGFLADGTPVVGGSYNCRKFDRFTVLSLGANGVPGDGGADVDALGTGDDIFQQW